MNPLSKLPVGLEVEVVQDVRLQDSTVESEMVVVASSRGTIPEPDASLGLFDISRVCPVILEQDDFLGIPVIVYLPWEAIEPIT